MAGNAQQTFLSKTIAYNSEGKPTATAQQDFEQLFPKNGWVEHDPEAIWQSQLNTINKVFSKGIKYVICTDVSKDGMLCGPSYKLYKHILNNSDEKIRLIASGGISTFEELPKLLDLGCEGVIIGKALYENRISLKQLESFILNQ